MNNFKEYMQKSATGKMVLGFLVPAMVVYFLMLLYSIPQVEQHANGMKLFDLSPSGYSHQYALELLKNLGSTGRDIYLYRQLPLDFIYPGMFAVSCCLLLTWLFKKSLIINSSMFYWCIIPLVAGLFDYLENICIILMLKSYPNVPELLVIFASIFTVFKSILTIIFFVLFFVGCGLFWKKIRKV
jgi:hypothetical protein